MGDLEASLWWFAWARKGVDRVLLAPGRGGSGERPPDGGGGGDAADNDDGGGGGDPSHRQQRRADGKPKLGAEAAEVRRRDPPNINYRGAACHRRSLSLARRTVCSTTNRV